MKSPVVVIGIGELGAVFARGLLRTGHPVFPVTRETDMALESASLPDPGLVLLAVAEKDLHPTLEGIPAPWRERLVLLQNELLPRDWERHGIDQPTVISVWFEKKKGMDSKVLLPSPAWGPAAETLHAALASIQIPVRVLDDRDALLFELVVKNVYIQEQLTGREFDAEALIRGMLAAFEGDPDHRCMGRSAPARLRRALSLADEAGLQAPTLRRIAASHL